MNLPVAGGSLGVYADATEAFAAELGVTANDGEGRVSPLFAPALTAPLCVAVLGPLLDGHFAPVVHLAEDIRFHTPAEAGDQLECRATVTSCRPGFRGATVVIDTEIASSQGSARATVRTTVQVVARRQWPAFGPKHLGDLTPRPRHFVELADYSPDADVGRRWARVTGDWQPIHLDDAAARAVGFPRRVVHGRHSLAMAGALLTEHLVRGDAERLRRLSVRFAKPIFPGDRVTLSVSDVVEGDDGPCRAWRAVANGRVVLRHGWVVFSGRLGKEHR